MDREGGQGGSALAIQISQAGWTDVIYLSIYLSIMYHSTKSVLQWYCACNYQASQEPYMLCQASPPAMA